MLLLPLALAAPPPLPPPLTAPRLDDVVGLHFGWPAGLTCETVETITRSGLGAGDGVVRVQRELRVEAVPGGVAVHQGRVVAEGAISAAASLALLRPAVVVGEDGHATGITAVEDHIQAVRTRAAQAVVRVDAAQKPALGLALRAASDAVGLQTRTIDEWERAVGVWSGVYVSEAVSGSAVANGPSALFPAGAAAQWFYSFHIEGRVPCGAEVGEPRCVTIAYEAAPWGGGKKALLGDAGGLLPPLPEGEAVTWTEVMIGLRGTLTLDPSTLVPTHRAEVTRLLAKATWPSGEQRLSLEASTDERWTCAVQRPAVIVDPLPPPPPTAPPITAPPPVPDGAPSLPTVAPPPPTEAPPLPPP